MECAGIRKRHMHYCAEVNTSEMSIASVVHLDDTIPCIMGDMLIVSGPGPES